MRKEWNVTEKQQEDMVTKASEMVIGMIRYFEGLRLKAYKCSADKLTIGYVHTSWVKAGQRCTKAQAEQWLKSDVAVVERQLNGLRLTLSQHQFDALLDFVFNIRSAKFAQSTLLRKIRQAAPTVEIQAEFRRWVYYTDKNGVLHKSDWQVARHEWEAQMWGKG
jgi:lysozyme